MHTKGAFTLIEIVIVLLIVGILTCLSLPTLQTYSMKPKFVQMLHDVHQIELSFNWIYAEKGKIGVGGPHGRQQYFSVNEFNSIFLNGSWDMPEENPYFDYRINSNGIGNFNVWVTVKECPASGTMSFRVFNKDNALSGNDCFWVVFTAHPWGKYLKMPGAKYY
jgi:prepilin-type N-terminal cleavage/methylation domain-containing protein